ncbi:TPA: type I restriction endonuclease subunit S [Enterococcus faecium]|nr:type I restriction endonuclease subunit S [Enterococcus faecium]AWV63050.1 type I restriction endonuclease subunit S [Enterococcus faecium]MBQ1142405.1 type I restriction endonuclease subunit S [Enterococcus faecium]MBQ1147625.1 type I restriction endonuclease subunit S [Enterococcus faecium]MCZ1280886.1 type I restriction endonuclease subunit S [Enterococcus faecium]
MQYMPGEDPIPNMKAIINSKDYEGYKAKHPEAKPFKYPQEMKRAWRKMLDDELIPLENELR